MPPGKGVQRQRWRWTTRDRHQMWSQGRGQHRSSGRGRVKERRGQPSKACKTADGPAPKKGPLLSSCTMARCGGRSGAGRACVRERGVGHEAGGVGVRGRPPQAAAVDRPAHTTCWCVGRCNGGGATCWAEGVPGSSRHARNCPSSETCCQGRQDVGQWSRESAETSADGGARSRARRERWADAERADLPPVNTSGGTFWPSAASVIARFRISSAVAASSASCTSWAPADMRGSGPGRGEEGVKQVASGVGVEETARNLCVVELRLTARHALGGEPIHRTNPVRRRRVNRTDPPSLPGGPCSQCGVGRYR